VPKLAVWLEEVVRVSFPSEPDLVQKFLSMTTVEMQLIIWSTNCSHCWPTLTDTGLSARFHRRTTIVMVAGSNVRGEQAAEKLVSKNAFAGGRFGKISFVSTTNSQQTNRLALFQRKSSSHAVDCFLRL
jgi:hypothetical protein